MMQLMIVLICLKWSLGEFNPCAPIPDSDFSKCAGGACEICIAQTVYWDKNNNASPINVALNKYSYRSEIPYTCEGSTYETWCNCVESYIESCGANNGFISKGLSGGCPNLPVSNCMQTSSVPATSSYWYVDMEIPVTVRFVSIWAIGRRTPTGQLDIAKMWTNLADTMIMVDSEWCLQTETNDQMQEKYEHAGSKIDDSSSSPGLRFFYFCTLGRVHRGRHIRLQKTPTATDKELGFCELQVFACKSGYSAVGETWHDESGSMACKPCSCIDHPCDNYYGCYDFKKDASRRGFNAAAYKNAEAKIPTSDLELATDGVRWPQDFACYFSNYSIVDSVSKKSTHWLSVKFDGMYLVMRAAVYAMAGFENTLTRFQVLAKTEVFSVWTLCWEKIGPLGLSYEAECKTCSKGYDNCPHASFAMFRDDGESHYLNLCEVMMYGHPMKENYVNGSCRTCKLEWCLVILECAENDTCIRQGEAIGKSCDPANPCKSPGLCESNRCMLPVGGNCKETPHLCASELYCQDGTCKLPLGAGPCSSDDICADNNTCDFTHKCRQGVGTKCSDDDVCVGGAECAAQRCVCKWGKESLRKLCVLVSPCQSNADCNAYGPANLVCKNSSCHCEVGFSLNDRNFICKLDAGQPCQNETDCSFGMVCQNATYNNSECRIVFKQPCQPSKQNECMAGTLCDRTKRRCLYGPSHSCNSSNDCVTETVCQSGACHLVKGEPCDLATGDDPCEVGQSCQFGADKTDENKLCVAVIGGKCVINRNCARGTVCEKGVCKADMLHSCKNSIDCRTNAQCSNGICFWKIGAPCNRSQAACGADAVCDFDDKCRYKVGKSCSQFPSFCRLRSRCNDAKTCECLEITQKSTETCDFKDSDKSLAFSKCSTKNENKATCADAGNAKCDPKTSICVCRDGYGPTEDLKCKPTVGRQCKQFCARGLMCENKQCVLPLGQPCFGEERSYCEYVALCDRDQSCRLKIGYSCGNGLSDRCETRTVCDPFNKCKLPSSNQICDRNISCVAGAKCLINYNGKFVCQCDESLSSNSTTHPGLCDLLEGQTGGPCNSDTCLDQNAECLTDGRCWCKEGFEVSEEDLTCKAAEGSPCTESNTCSLGTVCDTELKVCKRKLGFYCNASQAESCESGTKCDVGPMCRIDEGGKCDTEEKSLQCKVGTFCDIFQLCKVGYQLPCIDTKDCGAGMLCVEKKCVCNKIATELTAGWCKPRPGRVGSSCNPSAKEGQCSESQAQCNKDTSFCTCSTNSIKFPQTLSCQMAHSSKDEGANTPKGLFYLFYLFCVLLLMLLILAVVYRVKGAKKKDTMLEEMTQRQKRIEDLKLEMDELDIMRRHSPTPRGAVPSRKVPAKVVVEEDSKQESDSPTEDDEPVHEESTSSSSEDDDVYEV